MVLLLAGAVSAAAVPFWRAVLRGPSWIDQPRSDRHHRRPVSKVGGVAWLSGILVALWVASLGIAPEVGPAAGSAARWNPGFPMDAGTVTVMLLLAGALGWADDRGRVGPGAKWVLQSLLLLLGALATLLLGGESLPTPGWLVFSLLLALGLQTALEIFDNLDGALGITSLAGLLSISVRCTSPAGESAALAGAGASLGFLFWNRPPAKVHLGNLGSNAVALLVALLFFESLTGSRTGPDGGPRWWIGIPLIWPMADLLVVTWSRLRRGIPPWRGGRDHTTHRLARALGSDRAAALVIAVASGFGLILTLWMERAHR